MVKKLLLLAIALIVLLGCLTSPDKPVNENPSGDAGEIDVQIVAQNLEVPWAIDFLPDGRMIFTERAGNVKIFDGGFVHEVEGVVQLGESGLQGIAVDPNFSANSYIYLYYTYSQGTTLYNRVSRFSLLSNTLASEFVLLENIPGNVYHDGGRIKFGPDGMLYITTGDAGTAGNSQDKDSLAGKILRINPDGSIPADNPFGTAVYSYGHRNPQGFDWHPQSKMLVATEHGPSVHDEVNIIVKGANYGWPIKICSEGSPVHGYTEALVCFPQWPLAPSGAAFYGGLKLPFKDAFIYSGLRGEQIRIAHFNGNSLASDGLLLEGYGRVREIVQGRDGYIYFATNNTDGRGTPKQGDDKIYRIGPRNG